MDPTLPSGKRWPSLSPTQPTDTQLHARLLLARKLRGPMLRLQRLHGLCHPQAPCQNHLCPNHSNQSMPHSRKMSLLMIAGDLHRTAVIDLEDVDVVEEDLVAVVVELEGAWVRVTVPMGRQTGKQKAFLAHRAAQKTCTGEAASRVEATAAVADVEASHPTIALPV